MSYTLHGKEAKSPPSGPLTGERRERLIDCEIGDYVLHGSPKSGVAPPKDWRFELVWSSNGYRTVQTGVRVA